jgi:hypothetical protein
LVSQFTPDLQLRTLFVLNGEGRITSTREPNPTRGPLFSLIRSPIRCAAAVRADIRQELAVELDDLAQEEPVAVDLRDAPKHADRYLCLLGGAVDSGPAFTFPDVIAQPAGVVPVTDVRLLEHEFRGWTQDEIPERSPVLAVIEDGRAVSVCFCARRSEVAAEAGLDTAAAFRGRGLASRVTAAWALAIRASARLPIYSTSWSNRESLAVARKLSLVACASDWTVSD